MDFKRSMVTLAFIAYLVLWNGDIVESRFKVRTPQVLFETTKAPEPSP